MHPLKRHSSLWVSLVLLLFLMAHPTQSPAEAGGKIRLKWAFGALTGPENKAQLLSIEQNAVLHTGDRIKIFLQPQTDCHLYLFYRSSQNALLVLLPVEGSGSRSAAGIQHMVPAGSSWFQLDDVTGIETFYQLASARPLENLDTLCRGLSAER